MEVSDVANDDPFYRENGDSILSFPVDGPGFLAVVDPIAGGEVDGFSDIESH